MDPSAPARARAARRRRAAAHQCPHCSAVWALRVVAHPAGAVVRCIDCGQVRNAVPPLRTAGRLP
jgi:uncharacterized Zn finger protein